MNTTMIPNEKQLSFLDWEMGVFIHFGIRTFYEGHVDWDRKPMPLSAFDPTDLDTDKWMEVITKAGFKYAILTTKHHDGFCNWRTATNENNIAFTPWKDGKGDVVLDFVTSCRKYGVKVGLYYSPAEWDFEKRDAKEFDDYVATQLTELMTNYGEIDYIWFDDCGSDKYTYNTERYVDIMRSNQPGIRIFNMWDPDVKWANNEGGVGGIDLPKVWRMDYETNLEVIMHDPDECFMPIECDFRMRERNWFYSEYDAHTVKSPEEIMGLYYHSVGNGGNLLINIGPDRRGLFPELDSKNLIKFGENLKTRFNDPINKSFEIVGDYVQVMLEKPELVNQIVIEEDITNGEMITSFEVRPISRQIFNMPCIYKGTYVGRRRIVTFPPVASQSFTIKVTGKRGDFKIKKCELHYIKD